MAKKIIAAKTYYSTSYSISWQLSRLADSMQDRKDNNLFCSTKVCPYMHIVPKAKPSQSIHVSTRIDGNAYEELV